MPMDDLSQLRERAERWLSLAQQITDARAVEALRVEVARLTDQISRLEARGIRSVPLRRDDHS